MNKRRSRASDDWFSLGPIAALALLAAIVLPIHTAEAYQCCDPSLGCFGSPIIIDTTGQGFHLTSSEAGVEFDISGSGRSVRIGWTDSHFRNAFLALPG